MRIKTNVRKHIRRTTKGKRVLVRKHNRVVKRREPVGVYSRYEIKKASAPKGKKTKILEEIDEIQYNLTFPDISEERKSELEDKLDNLEQQAKRITGRPPVKLVSGKNITEIETQLAERYAGTSSRKPDFVKVLDLPSDIHSPYEKLMQHMKQQSQRERSREIMSTKRLMDILEEKSLQHAIDSPEEDLVIKLKDIERSPRGRKLKRLMGE